MEGTLVLEAVAGMDHEVAEASVEDAMTTEVYII